MYLCSYGLFRDHRKLSNGSSYDQQNGLLLFLRLLREKTQVSMTIPQLISRRASAEGC